MELEVELEWGELVITIYVDGLQVASDSIALDELKEALEYGEYESK